MRYAFAISSRLRAPADRVWARASTFAGVNRELRPLFRMTYPPTHARITPGAFPPGRPGFRSWVLLFGLVPVDFDDVTLAELEPGRGFLEVSRLGSMHEWSHRRTVSPVAGGCVVRDEVSFVPRLRWVGPVLLGAFRLTFELRHCNLRRAFGAVRG